MLQSDGEELSPRSPLVELLTLLNNQWSRIANTNNLDDYLEWLEETAPLSFDVEMEEESFTQVIETLDVLDGILLAAIVELEELSSEDLSPDELENKIQQVWRRCYAHYVAGQEADLERIFLHRGKILVERIYPNRDGRRRLYRSNLPPRSGVQLLNLFSGLQDHLQAGLEYAEWDSDTRFAFIESTVEMLGSITRFKPQERIGRAEVDWRLILRWWLDPQGALDTPSIEQVSNWHRYIKDNFQYRFNWGLGNFISLAIDEAIGGLFRENTIDDWHATDLPWVVIWMKDIITWGTLDPVAAYILSKDLAVKRSEAELLAKQYYYDADIDMANDLLNPTHIREWTEISFPSTEDDRVIGPPRQISVELLRDFSNAPDQNWRVIPVVKEGNIQWMDPAGFLMAEGAGEEPWNLDWWREWDFVLDHVKGTVSSKRYLT